MAREFQGRLVKHGDEHFLFFEEDITENSPFKKGDNLHCAIEDGRLIFRKARPGEEPSIKIT